MQTYKHFMGADGFIWFTGVVEDRDDPEALGRVRVRCLGYHSEDLKNQIIQKVSMTQEVLIVNNHFMLGLQPMGLIQLMVKML